MLGFLLALMHYKLEAEESLHDPKLGGNGSWSCVRLAQLGGKRMRLSSSRHTRLRGASCGKHTRQ